MRRHYQVIVSGHLETGVSELTQKLDDLSRGEWRVDHVILLPEDGGHPKFLIVYSEERG